MELMNEMQAQMAELRPAVQWWMNWMMFIFLAGVVFAWKRTGARWTLVALAAAMALVPILFLLTGSVHTFGIAHFIFWLPLLVYLVRTEMKKPELDMVSPYGIWVLLLSATIAISLLFDARDLVLIALGQK